MDAVIDQLRQGKVVAVIRRLLPTVWEDVVRSLVNGGIHILEVTMDAADAPKQIEHVLANYGDSVLVGAGTVLTVEQARQAVAVGSKFLVCPHLDEELMDEANRLGVPMIPGVMTPSEIRRAIKYGAKTVKVFPANVVGPGFVRDVLGPFSGLSMMVTGGLTLDNFASFLQAGAEMVGLGSFLFPRSDLDEMNWVAIEERAKKIMMAIK